MVVGGAACNVGVAIIGGSVVDVMPAADKDVVARGVGGGVLVFEVLDERECRNRAAGCCHTHRSAKAGVASRADGSDG